MFKRQQIKRFCTLFIENKILLCKLNTSTKSGGK